MADAVTDVLKALASLFFGGETLCQAEGEGPVKAAAVGVHVFYIHVTTSPVIH